MHEKLVFGIHRGGSTILGVVASKISKHFGFPFVPLNQKADKAFKILGPDGATDYIYDKNGKRVFDCNESPKVVANISNWRARSQDDAMFGPIRDARYFASELYNPYDLAILNIRDPRDCMTSAYWGFLRLHGNGLQDQNKKDMYEKGIDWYVANKALPLFEFKLNSYIELIRKINSPRFKVLRYEDMVCNFSIWYTQFCEHFEFKDAANESDLIARLKANFDPVNSEDIDKHKRQMLPGDHQNKLSAETIDYVNSKLASQLNFFGYI